MQRREFLTASTAAALGMVSGGAPGPARAAEAQPAGDPARLLLELRAYHFATPEKLQAFDQFFAKAATPALNRAGVEPVGVFKLLAKDNPALKLTADGLDLYVLLPHPSFEAFSQLAGRLQADEAFQKDGHAILNAPKADPAFLRYDSSLLLAFEGFPRVQVPTKAQGRLLQLRVYESHTAERAARKVRMFNAGGELAIFRRAGMTGVFFGQALAGTKLPNLTYLLAFDDEPAHARAWDAFRADPEWKRLSADEAYKDTVSTITSLILRPGAGSQI